MNQSSKTPKKTKKVVPKSGWIPDDLFQAIQKSMPVPCVDLLPVRRNKDGKIEILLIKRQIYPEIGKWGLIGGRILKDELTNSSIMRQARRELGVSVKIIQPWTELHPFAVFNDPFSDIQKHFVVLTYLVHITNGKVKATGPEFSEAKWFPLDNLPKRFSFHHKKVVTMLKHYFVNNLLSV